jgi:hypothetical protein
MHLELNQVDIPKLKARLVDGPARGIHWGNLPQLDEHLAHMRQDFVGLPELCLVHGQLIALIRRRIELVHNVPTFLALWDAETTFLTTHLNSRWLVSACDTFSDHGSELQRPRAAVLTALFHSLQLCETERLALKDPSYDREKYQDVMATHRAGRHLQLWDGMKAYAFEDGDSARMMFGRVIETLDQDAVIGPIARTLIARAIDGDTLFGRLSKLNPDFLPPAPSRSKEYHLPVLTGSLNGFNVILFEGRFLVVPQSLGPLDLSMPEARRAPGIVVTRTIQEARRVAESNGNAGSADL